MIISKLMVAQHRPCILKHCIRYLSEDAPLRRPTLQKKIMYTGNLTSQIKVLKGFSITSSSIMIAGFSHMISQKGLSTAIITFGVISLPFILSPIVIAWFFKRYVCELSYNPATQKYTAINFGYLFDRKKYTFSPGQVERVPLSLINTFKVGDVKFFMDPDGLNDSESVHLYKSMVGLDKEQPSGESSK